MYSCDNCDYQVAHPRNLINHQKSNHEGVRYSCDKCDYHAKRQDNLHAHKKNVHEGKKRNFQSGRKRELNKHNQRTSTTWIGTKCHRKHVSSIIMKINHSLTDHIWNALSVFYNLNFDWSKIRKTSSDWAPSHFLYLSMLSYSKGTYNVYKKILVSNYLQGIQEA